MRTLMLATTTFLLLGCERGTETRTFALQYLDPEAAQAMIEPYVPAAGTNLRHTTEPASLTITAPEVRLDQITQVLQTHDRPLPNVRLRFQVIEADGFAETDAAISDVEQALRELFRFAGYRLIDEAVVQAKASSHVETQLGSGEDEYEIMAGLEGVVTGDNGKAVELWVTLSSSRGQVLATSLTVPSGQTVVVGSARSQADGRTVILVVRPVIE
ncbi:MAG: hypothetical protein WEF86_00750 [Gemmatimonadota bacterium]